MKMYPYKAGDVVRVYNYPFQPKSKQDDSESDKKQGKERYGLVINYGGKYATTVPILPISTHKGKTEREGYILRDDEVRVPRGINYKKRNGVKELIGVIKTERIEHFEQDEISAPLTKIPLRTKLDIISQYEHICNIPFYQNLLKNNSPNHEKAMKLFKESVLAEKLNFLVTDDGKRMYDIMRYTSLKLDKIQPLGYIGKNNSIGIYSVELKGNKDSFIYTIGTLKSKEQVVKDWKNPKKAYQWLSEDIKYNILKKDIDKDLKPDPLIDSNKYVKFNDFSKDVLKDIKEKQKDIEL